MDLTREKLPDLGISRRGNHNFPQRSCDLTSCDVFLWGHAKKNVFANRPASIQELKVGIHKAVDDIGQPLCNLVMENFMKKIWSCISGRVGHLADLIFYNIINGISATL